MEKVSIEGIENQPNPLARQSVRRPVSDALGTGDFAMNYFELDTGESFSGGLHTHHDQEEVFYVQSGTATFEVGHERERIEVGAGELIRFAPGEFQTGTNEGDERVIGFALGAPDASHDFAEIESVIPCRECGEETVHGASRDDDAFVFTCRECGNSFSPA